MLECTNSLSLITIVEEAREQKINYKGQWKRRARIKAIESIKEGKIDQTIEGNDRLKIKRGTSNENFLEDTELQSRKKNKNEEGRTITQIFEVVETSQDWSQSYK